VERAKARNPLNARELKRKRAKARSSQRARARLARRVAKAKAGKKQLRTKLARRKKLILVAMGFQILMRKDVNAK